MHLKVMLNSPTPRILVCSRLQFKQIIFGHMKILPARSTSQTVIKYHYSKNSRQLLLIPVLMRDSSANSLLIYSKIATTVCVSD